MSDTDSDILVSCTPPELKSIVNSALSDFIPKKSKRQYEKCYSEFKDWCDKQNVKTMSKNNLLAYLMQQSKVVKSSTLWSIYSMLKCLLNIREGIDVRKFLKLVPFLERKAVVLKTAFDTFDVEKKGSIGTVMIGTILGMLGIHTTDQMLTDIINEVDEDGSGELEFEGVCYLGF
ncbi:hypothetical protein NQ317_013640 [Molorchus minor]|uniref:EF-hand domain-containing protein n=1 Tax=Molorchus minor TaxID=1323400 RepID=A0ABQ9JVA9_9CUCU|nr:hypothetical protein NQ317_013640 [Molorchus minor]